MIGRLLERLFVSVQADLSQLASQLQAGIFQTRKATDVMASSWSKVEASVQKLYAEMKAGTITAGQYTSAMNKLASQMKEVAGSYQLAQKQVWSYHSAASQVNRVPPLNPPREPIEKFSRSVGMARSNIMNLGYQLNDIGVSLAGGMNPLTVLIQQGSQISQIYAGNGGLRTALGDIGKIGMRLAPAAAAVAAVAAAFALVQREINKTSEVNVQFVDVLNGTWAATKAAIIDAFSPLKDTVTPWWNTFLDFLGNILVKAGNLIINSFHAAWYDVTYLWDQFPNMMKAVFTSSVNYVKDAINEMIIATQEGVNYMIRALNNIPGVDIAEITGVHTLKKEINSAAQDLAKATEVRNQKINEIMNSNPLGDAFSSIKDKSIEAAYKRIAEEADDAGEKVKKIKDLKVTPDMEDAVKLFKTLGEESKTAADNLAGVFGNAFETLAETGKLTFSSFIQDMNKLVIQSTSKLLQQELSNMFQSLSQSQGGLGSLFSNLFSSLFGGGGTGFGLSGRAVGGVEMPWKSFVAGERGAELISQDGPGGARRVMTAGRTRQALGGQSGGNTINFYVTTPDAESFKKSQSQIAGRANTFLSRGRRNQ